MNKDIETTKKFVSELDYVIVCIGIILMLAGEGFPFFYLMTINMVVCFLYAITPIRKNNYILLVILILIANFLILFNAEGWNEGSMQGRYDYIEILKPTTDMIYGTILFSGFVLGIPIILYIFLINSLDKLTHYLSNPDKFKLKEELDKK